MQVLDVEEIAHPYFRDRQKMLAVIEDCYHFWRNMQRYSIIYTRNEEGQLANFMEADAKFHQMILDFYRTVQQKTQGSKKPRVPAASGRDQRQPAAKGLSVACAGRLSRTERYSVCAYDYDAHPLIIHPRSNKRLGMFTEVGANPMAEWVKGDEEWMCFPLKVGSLLCYTYFHRDFDRRSREALANLFELASDEDCIGAKPDLLFVRQSRRSERHGVLSRSGQRDVGRQGVLRRCHRIFWLSEKMILTPHNLAMIEKGWLPPHGAMINLTPQDGTKKASS